jgi:hypothetical protein
VSLLMLKWKGPPCLGEGGRRGSLWGPEPKWRGKGTDPRRGDPSDPELDPLPLAVGSLAGGSGPTWQWLNARGPTAGEPRRTRCPQRREEASCATDRGQSWDEDEV